MHQKYFYVLVLDFLSKNSDKRLVGESMSCLDSLEVLAQKPLLAGKSDSLNDSLVAFRKWLNKKLVRKIFLGEGSVEVELTRQELIYISANISKHHFGHLTSVISKIKRADKGQNEDYEIVQGLEAIYFDLHENVLNYHGSVIAQFLNDIRIGIYDYLLPEYKRSYTKLDEGYYRYIYPVGIESELGMSCYWNIMNFVRGKPYMKSFVAHEYLTMRY